MSRYVFIESRDPFESSDTRFIAETAAALKRQGEDVTVFLVQNGVLAARAKARGSQLPELAEARVTLLADDFSLRERGISTSELAAAVQEANIDSLVDLIAHEDTKAIWH